MLELQPTLEDVFHADTTSVEDYLQQIQDMTILTAIQVGCLILNTFWTYLPSCPVTAGSFVENFELYNGLESTTRL